MVALERWPDAGVPNKPGAWITTTARRKAVDRLRREGKRTTKQAEAARTEAIARAGEPNNMRPDSAVADDRLRLIFTCCHPALDEAAQVALTLRLLGGLTTAEIARAFLVAEPTMAQRLTRAKGKIRDAGIAYRVPDATDLPARLDSVLSTLYLIFNEGYSVMRNELASEAIRLARVLVELMPDEPEARGLLALMLLQHSRRRARTDANGDLVLLPDQDRSLWDAADIADGLEVLPPAANGTYQLQAAIAAEHAKAYTDWSAIAGLYVRLLELHPTPVVALNHAVAVAEADGPERGLTLVDSLADELDGYYLFHSARADLLRRLDRTADAAAAYRRARDLTANEAERAFLDRRRASLTEG